MVRSFSPFKAERMGIAQIAEKSPAKAYGALATRNLANTAISLYAAPTPLLLATGEVAKNIFFQQNMVARVGKGLEPGFFKDPTNFTLDTIHNTFNHDLLAQGLVGLAVGLPAVFLLWTVGRGIQAGVAAYQEHKTSKPPLYRPDRSRTRAGASV